MFLKMHYKNSTRLGFRWLTKSVEIIKLYKRSFSRCYSLCFYISMIAGNSFFRVQYFTKVVVANHSSMDALFLRRTQSTINYIYRCTWQIFLFQTDFYFKGALAAIHLSGTIIISGGHLQWSSIFKGIVFLLNKHLQSSLFS